MIFVLLAELKCEPWEHKRDFVHKGIGLASLYIKLAAPEKIYYSHICLPLLCYDEFVPNSV